VRAYPIPLSSLLLVAMMAPANGQQRPQPDVEAFEAHAVEVEGVRYPYRLLTPRPDQRDVARPLVVFLHGAGERGDDNLRQLTWLPQRLARPELRERYPCYLLALQCPDDARWVEVAWGEREPQPMPDRPSRPMRAVLQALDEVLRRDGVDPARVYLTGLSMGGYGAWDLAVRHADRFAAALAVCGGGDPTRVGALCGLPMQVFHGVDDPVVPIDQTRAMVAAFARHGMPLQAHQLPGVEHDAWQVAYGPDGGLDWLFAQDQRQQRRGRWAELPVVPRLERTDAVDGAFRLGRGARCHTPAELRPLAAYLLDQLDLPATARPGLVDGDDGAAGDLVLRLEPRLDAAFVLDVGERLVVRAQDLGAMADATAALFQALRAGGDDGVPFGCYRMGAVASDDALVVDVGSPDWTRESLHALLRECWLGSVDEVFFVRDPTRHDRNAWREFTVLVDRVGVRVVGSNPAPGDRLVVAADDRADDVLQRAPAGGGYLVTVRADTPSGLAIAARRLLPAALERSRQHHGPVHAAGFRARLIGRCR
jgi:poly(3-hydroxybutyrate) depolymerase